MKKKIIAGLSIGLIILSAFCVYNALNLTNYRFVKARAVNYLCDKYDAEKDEFELVDYKHSRLVIEDYQEIFDVLQWCDFSFEFKYKDKSFFVNRYKGKFYDDYQIDDIEIWCTEWLQENVDENIVGVSFDSMSIADCLRRTNMTNKHVFTKNDAEIFIMNCYSKKGHPTYISYHLDDFKYDERFAISDNISKSINEELFTNDQFQIGITKELKMNRKALKSNSDNWIVRYSVLF